MNTTDAVDMIVSGSYSGMIFETAKPPEFWRTYDTGEALHITAPAMQEIKGRKGAKRYTTDPSKASDYDLRSFITLVLLQPSKKYIGSPNNPKAKSSKVSRVVPTQGGITLTLKEGLGKIIVFY